LAGHSQLPKQQGIFRVVPDMSGQMRGGIIMAAQLAEDLARNGLYGITADGRVIGHIDAFLRLDAVKRATGLSTSTIYELMEAGFVSQGR
jgi:hypothetical protein